MEYIRAHTHADTHALKGIKLVISLINFGLLAAFLQLHECVLCEGQL